MFRGKVLLAVGLVATVLIMSGAAAADDWFNWTFGEKGVKGSGDMVSETRELEEFTRIETCGAFDVFVKVGAKQRVSITFDDNLLKFVETEIRGKTLTIFSDESYRSKHTCKIEITVPELKRVTTKGSGDISVENVRGGRFSCRTKGSGDIAVNGIEADRVQCSINGSGDITLTDVQGGFLECRISGSGDFSADGRVEELEVNVYGSGDVDAPDLRAKETTVTIKGSGDARVYAEKSFEGSVYGSGDIAYYGDPRHTSKQVVGSGSIRHR